MTPSVFDNCVLVGTVRQVVRKILLEGVKVEEKDQCKYTLVCWWYIVCVTQRFRMCCSKKFIYMVWTSVGPRVNFYKSKIGGLCMENGRPRRNACGNNPINKTFDIILRIKLRKSYIGRKTCICPLWVDYAK